MMPSAWYFPHNNQQLSLFYFAVCVTYVIIHIIWDGVAINTPPFSLQDLYLKSWLVFSSTTLASGLFYIVILFDLDNPLRYSDAFIFPLVVSALYGIMVSVSSLAPRPCG